MEPKQWSAEKTAPMNLSGILALGCEALAWPSGLGRACKIPPAKPYSLACR